MKTLADLKRNCVNYEFKLCENSWFKQLPVFQKEYRKVGRVQSNRFTLLTDKNGNGELIESWLDFPKASEIQLIPLNDSQYCLIIKQECEQSEYDIEHFGKKPPHIMIYELRKVS